MNIFLKKFRGNNLKTGFTLVEILIYIATMLVMLIILFSVLVLFVKISRNIKVNQNIQNSAVLVLERMTREIHDAKSPGASSVYTTSPGILVLNTVDGSNNPRTVMFSVVNGELHITENSIDLGALTLPNVSITNLIFNLITTTNSKAIKIQFTLSSNNGSFVKTENFYTTAILRSP